MTSVPCPNISNNITLFLIKAAEMFASIFLKNIIHIFSSAISDCRTTTPKHIKPSVKEVNFHDARHKTITYAPIRNCTVYCSQIRLPKIKHSFYLGHPNVALIFPGFSVSSHSNFPNLLFQSSVLNCFAMTSRFVCLFKYQPYLVIWFNCRLKNARIHSKVWLQSNIPYIPTLNTDEPPRFLRVSL